MTPPADSLHPTSLGRTLLPDDELASLTSRFSRFEAEVRGRSPLYAHYSAAIANDDAIAFVLSAAAPAQRRPNLLFAAVHDLLLSGVEHPLAVYYPSVGGDRRPDCDTMPAFRAFLADCQAEILSRVRRRSTQTNEPGRCAALVLALGWAVGDRGWPVALVELGASAGLLLHMDRYHYRWGEMDHGPRTSPVEIACAVHGRRVEPAPLPAIMARVGIDLEPLSVKDSEDSRWLRACVWPEDTGRLARLEAALEVAAAHDDVRMVAGDVVSELRGVVHGLPQDALVVVVHSATLAYLDDATRTSVERDLDALGSERDLVRICFEGPFLEPFRTLEREVPTAPPEDDRFLLGLTRWTGGQRVDELLARAHPHGAWLEWVAA